MTWALLLLFAGLLGLFLYWQLIVAEGAYLGRRVVVALYDLTAWRYDRIKRFEPEEEDWFLARPLCRALANVAQPRVLDVATGTARLPLALLRRPDFRGRVWGLDLSIGMLRQAQVKAQPYAQRLLLLQQGASRLPFGDDGFDVVTCLEALEFLPHPRRALAEMVRVLRPGGLLLVSNRIGWEATLLPGRAYSRAQLQTLLDSLPLTVLKITSWQESYELVWARKK